jgi:hypothetical protein
MFIFQRHQQNCSGPKLEIIMYENETWSPTLTQEHTLQLSGSEAITRRNVDESSGVITAIRNEELPHSYASDAARAETLWYGHSDLDMMGRTAQYKKGTKRGVKADERLFISKAHHL